MRWLAALLLLSLALAGVALPLCPVDVDGCSAQADVLGAQAAATDDSLDDNPSVLPEPVVAVDVPGSSSPEPAPARHTPLLHDQRQYRPPRA